MRRRGLAAAAVASAGIAALLLEGGRAAHSRLKLPIHVTNESTFSANKAGGASNYLAGLSLIIWDEAPMSHLVLIERLGRSLRDIRPGDRPFGAVVVVFSGDFRHIPPVVRRGSRAQIVASSIKRPPIWANVRRRRLTRDVRLVGGGDEFATYLLRIGDGEEITAAGEDSIELPIDICAGASHVGGQRAELGRAVFPEIETRCADEEYLLSGAVLATKNEDIGRIDAAITERFHGEMYDLKSADSVARDTDAGLYPEEFLNSIEGSGIPPRHLRLMVGMPVILLRNLHAAHGLCNGSRHIVRRIFPRCVEVELFSSKNSGLREFTPHRPIQPSAADMPFALVRYQFPHAALLRNYCQQKPGPYHPSRRPISTAQCIRSRPVVRGDERGEEEVQHICTPTIYGRSPYNQERGIQKALAMNPSA